jgi:hypothetical protein
MKTVDEKKTGFSLAYATLDEREISHEFCMLDWCSALDTTIEIALKLSSHTNWVSSFAPDEARNMFHCVRVDIQPRLQAGSGVDDRRRAVVQSLEKALASTLAQLNTPAVNIQGFRKYQSSVPWEIGTSAYIELYVYVNSSSTKEEVDEQKQSVERHRPYYYM